METRFATKNDFGLFLLIKREFNKDSGIFEKSDDFVLKEFEDYLNKGAIIISLVDEKIVGYLLGIVEEDMYEKFGHIGEVFVSKEFR